LNEPYTILPEYRKQESGLIFIGYRNKKIRKAGVRPGTEHLSRVHKQPNRIYSSEGLHPALPSQESSGRFWIYDGGVVRKLTIKECYRIMGFPETFKLINNPGELYRQIGNSVCIPMIKAIAKQIKEQLL
jgi:DNA (cytosine-5)-methyltransferase 1